MSNLMALGFDEHFSSDHQMNGFRRYNDGLDPHSRIAVAQKYVFPKETSNL